jgi:hypothetical protein
MLQELTTWALGFLRMLSCLARSSHATEEPVGYATTNTLKYAHLSCFPSSAKWKPLTKFFETSWFLLDRVGERRKRSLGLAKLMILLPW